jgi:ribosomal 50S subunit-recycling heat shock protein
MAGGPAAAVVHERVAPFASERPRLDAFLVDSDLGLTRAQAQRLIDDGDVTVDGARSRPRPACGSSRAPRWW